MSSISEHIELDNKHQSSIWWLKNTAQNAKIRNTVNNMKDAELTSPKHLSLDLSNSVEELFEKDNESAVEDPSDADIGSIIEEINKLASQSPIGRYENISTDRSVEDILKEAEKLYFESSKSFEQLSSKSKSPFGYSLSKSSSLSKKLKKSTSTPKSQISSHTDFSHSSNSDNSEVSEHFDNKASTTLQNNNEDENDNYQKETSESNSAHTSNHQSVHSENELHITLSDTDKSFHDRKNNEIVINVVDDKIDNLENKDSEEVYLEEEFELDKMEAEENIENSSRDEQSKQNDALNELHAEIESLKSQLKDTKRILEENEKVINRKSFNMNQELESVIEELKDTKELNTALQLQLDNLTKTHQELKISYDELMTSKKSLESRLVDLDSNFTRCKTELTNLRESNEKLLESEMNLKRLLDIEKLQSKTTRLQNEKDAKCILDLNRQVKEMERIIQRKHPDSVSALIVTSKSENDFNNAARTLLENRIKQLEFEANTRESQSNKVFGEVQEKFNLMKAKYESHIEDLETHVNDLKKQLISKSDTYDIYTQTYTEESLLSRNDDKKNTFSVGIQTEQLKPTKIAKKPDKPNSKDDAHLLATIRGLQSDISGKEKLISKLQKEMEEIHKVTRKLQREREISLRNGPEKFREDKTVHDKSVKSVPSELCLNTIDKDILILKDERDKLKAQLCRLEDDYQNLKTKRLQDLNVLQEAHEREITTYMSNIAPMREQLDVQQITINNLQGQLASAKEELAIITIERDHLDSKLKNIIVMETDCSSDDNVQISLQKKITYLERRYEEREHRLRAIVHGLAQKQVTARDCAQCAARQQQLIGYKAELDQLLATLRYLQ